MGSLSLDVNLHDTYFVVAHFHYTMMGGVLMGFLGAIHYWWPKMFGKMYDEFLAKIACFLIVIGFNVVFFPQFLMGAKGMPRRYHVYDPEFQVYHVISTVGSWVLAVGVILMAYYLIQSIRKGEKAPSNPWGALTLEWQTTSPPILENFEITPTVTCGPYEYKGSNS